MASKVIAGVTVQVNDEGFLTNPNEWTKEIAAEIAKEEGVSLEELSRTRGDDVDHMTDKRTFRKGLEGGIVIDGRITGWVSIAADITERKKAEDALRQTFEVSIFPEWTIAGIKPDLIFIFSISATNACVSG